ncbi:MAG TPA: TadE/TadG family type IV pilus assembly protein [Bryobacteraceae bacterium]
MKTTFLRTASARRRRRQKGSALLEGALCFLGFLMLTVGLMEFSMAMYAYNFCTYSARDAARWAATQGSDKTVPATCANNVGTIPSFVTSEAIALESSRFTVSCAWSPDNAPGAQLSVTVTYSIAPLVGLVIRGPMTVSSTSKTTVVY